VSRYKTKDDLLRHYADRNPKAFRQFDGWLDADEIMGRDPETSRALNASTTLELMRGADVRVLIPLSTTRAEAVTLLREIAAWIARDGGGLDALCEIEARESGENVVPFSR
jgi:hypothetical protein